MLHGCSSHGSGQTCIVPLWNFDPGRLVNIKIAATAGCSSQKNIKKYGILMYCSMCFDVFYRIWSTSISVKNEKSKLEGWLISALCLLPPTQSPGSLPGPTFDALGQYQLLWDPGTKPSADLWSHLLHRSQDPLESAWGRSSRSTNRMLFQGIQRTEMDNLPFALKLCFPKFV